MSAPPPHPPTLLPDSHPLSGYRHAWERKPVLRTVYRDIFRRMVDKLVDGPTLEVGGGVGGLKEYAPKIIASDIQTSPWLDLVCDAQRLPFADGSLANIVMLDVLHHIEFPLLFLHEAARALKPGGRIVMCEPAITPASTIFYRFLHPEPVNMQADPLLVGLPDKDRDPYHSNQAIPTLLATRDRARLEALCPELKLASADWFSVAVYPLSGGFQKWALIGDSVARAGLKLEQLIEPVAGRLLGFRLLLVVEKRSVTA